MAVLERQHSQQEPLEEPIEHELLRLAEAYARSMDYEISLGCRQELLTLFSSSATVIQLDYRPRDQKTEIAQRNIHLLIDMMVEEAKKERIMVLHEWSFGKAWGKLRLKCPVFPFC